MTEAVVTERVSGMPVGSTPAVPRRAGARTGARARVATTLRDGKVVKVLRVVRSDVAGSWLWRSQPPSLAQMWAGRRPVLASIPAEHVGLYRVEVCWRTGAVFVLWPLFAYLWLLHRAVTGVPTVAVTAALAVMWLI